MTWGEKIHRLLRGQKELEMQLTLGFLPQRLQRTYTASCEHDGLTVRVDVEDFDRFGILLHDMHFELDAGDAEAKDRFDRQIRELSTHSCPLNSELSVIERDDNVRHAIIRTVPDSARRFFEIELRGGYEARLAHFAVDEKTRKREQTPANMGMESFVNTVDWLFGVFGNNGFR